MADKLAARVERETGGDARRQVDRAFHIVFSRPASAAERDSLAGFIEANGLAALCRVLLNSNEFMYVD
jgi:hypothetical protein